MTGKRALVLAGGGIAGIAWEIGILQGIADVSPSAVQALLASDVLLGTSAGSAVAAQIAGPLQLHELYARQIAEASHEIDSGVDSGTVTQLFLRAMADRKAPTQEKLRRIGVVALSTPTVTEAVRRKVIEYRLAAHDWPARDLRITATDTTNGELVVFDSSSGVDLVDAVAASCAVPGSWPPVTIGATRYMDGGVGSSVNMAVAADCETAVVVVPAGANAPSPFNAGAAAEISNFAGRTFPVFADSASLRAFGPNPLDPRCRIPSAMAGREQGRQLAGIVTEFLGL